MTISDQLIEALHRMEKSLSDIRDMLTMRTEEELQLAEGDTWLDKQQVMQMLHISDRTLFTMRKEGKLTAYTIRGKIYFRMEDIENALKGRD
ncbi:MAG TPA: helix-turn-helix domain-containing protein [Sphingobacteriaceae bacterium]